MTTRERTLASLPLLVLGLAALATAPAAGADEWQHEYVGVILPRQAVDVTAMLQLPIKSVYIALDDECDPNTLIAELDTASIEEELNIICAAVELAKKEVLEAEMRVGVEEKLCAVIQGLYDNRVASEKEKLDAELRLAIAKFELASANVRIKQQEGRKRQLEHELDKGRITAPFRGIVAACYRGQGDLGGPGIPIVRLVSHETFVRFAVEPADAVRLRRGQAVAVEVPELLLSLTARVKRIAPEVDAASGRVVVEAAWSSPNGPQTPARVDRGVRPGMVVHVRSLGNP